MTTKTVTSLEHIHKKGRFGNYQKQNGKNMIGQKLFAMSPLKNKTIPVEIVSSHYVDPKGERVRS